MAISPTERSLKWLRNRSYMAEVVEKWNPHSKTRKDLFGFIDIVAIRTGETLAIQATSGSNASARVNKILEHDSFPLVVEAGWDIVVHAWRKNAKGRWVLREIIVS